MRKKKIVQLLLSYLVQNLCIKKMMGKNPLANRMDKKFHILTFLTLLLFFVFFCETVN